MPSQTIALPQALQVCNILQLQQTPVMQSQASNASRFPCFPAWKAKRKKDIEDVKSAAANAPAHLQN